MTVKEFADVVNNAVISGAKIYEKYWNEDLNLYDDTKDIDKKVNSKKDLEPYYDYELDSFEMYFSFGKWSSSHIYIKMLREQEK